jgi:putative hydrolases of HD superfamily
LQQTPRTGWVRSGVANPESIADHMYRMAVLALTTAGSEYDQCKLVKMAIVHDLAEALVGDIAPSDNVPAAEKHAREAAALKEIVEDLGADTVAAQEISDLW